MFPLLVFRHDYNGQKHFALFVARHTEPRALIIVMDEAPFIQYYGHRDTLTPPLGNQEEIDVFIKKINHCFKEDVPVYLVQEGLDYLRRDNLKKGFFRDFKIQLIGRQLTEDFHFPELRFYAYQEGLYKVKIKDE
jgi:hypothetical protein